MSDYDDSCPFCQRIRAGEYDYEFPSVVVFAPLSPVTEGHMLAVPKLHRSNAITSPWSAGVTMTAAAEYASAHKLGACNFITSAGAAATQTVYHLHVHVVPRREGDGLALPWTGQQEAVW